MFRMPTTNYSCNMHCLAILIVVFFIATVTWCMRIQVVALPQRICWLTKKYAATLYIVLVVNTRTTSTACMTAAVGNQHKFAQNNRLHFSYPNFLPQLYFSGPYIANACAWNAICLPLHLVFQSDFSLCAQMYIYLTVRLTQSTRISLSLVQLFLLLLLT